MIDRDVIDRVGAPVRYAVTAAGCLCLHNFIMIAADRAGLTMMQAAATSFCIMVVVGYLLLSLWAFRTQPNWQGFARYVGVMALNFPASTTLLWLFLKLMAQPMAIAAPAATLGMVLLNYVASRWAVLNRGPAGSGVTR